MSLSLKLKQAKSTLHHQMEKELSTYKERWIDENGNAHERAINNQYFLINDVWNIHFLGAIENFREGILKRNFNRQNIYFLFESSKINLEMKYFVYRKLFDDQWTMNTLFIGQANSLQRLNKFLSEKYAGLDSFLELDIEKANRQWLFWLEEQGTATSYIDKRTGKSIKSPLAKFFINLYVEFMRLIDSRDEWDKEVWDVRSLNKLYGIYYNRAMNHVTIDFTVIKNLRFRKEIQSYLKRRLLSNDLTWGTAKNYMVAIPYFLDFIKSLEPTWTGFNELSREHMVKYFDQLHLDNKQRQRKSESYDFIINAVSSVKKFLEGLQETGSDIAPNKDIRTLIFTSDKPQQKRQNSNKMDYIPDSVLEQLFENINYLQEELQPVIWISFKTGLRLSDTLRLTQNCLVQLNGKYQIVTDISKTNVQDHSIPIDDELARVIAVLIDQSKENSNHDNNPHQYIFVRYRGRRKGRPFSRDWVGESLNKLAINRNIINDSGQVYHFRMHQFRHTYAVKMLNSGADILTVQYLLAHSSPEMTTRYAKLLDTTKRRVFEEAMKQGLFSFDLNGEMKQVEPNEETPQEILEMLWLNHKLNAIDNPYGTCHARLNGNCPFSEEPPCLTCNGGSPCKDLAIGISELDTQKYQLLIKTTSRTIEALEQRGRSDIAEKNKKNLSRYQSILNTIQNGNIIFGRLDRVNRKDKVSMNG